MSWNYLLTQWWLILAMGLVASAFAFVAGRRFFVRGASAKARPPEERTPAESLADALPSERRRAVRRSGHAVEVDLWGPQGQGPSLHGWVVNRSLGGLCVEVDQAVEVGITLKVKVCNPAPSAFPHDISVRNCRPMGSAWHVSCQFITTPSYGALLMFG